MNKTWAVLLAVVPVVYLATQGSAQEPKDRPGPGNPDVMFQRLDKNQDGKITADEVPEAAPEFLKEFLKRSDKDQDKAVTKDEIKATFPPFQPGARPGAAGGPRPGMPGVPGAGQFGRGFPPGPPAGGPQFRRPQPFSGGPPRPGFAAFGPGQPPQVPDPAVLFKRLDRDNDQKLSLEEFTAGMKAFHERMRGAGRPPMGPAPGMGTRGPRSAAPWVHRPWPPVAGRPGFGPVHGRPPHAGMLIARLKAADTDKDGKLSKSEAPPMLQQHFDRIDANKDGQIDRHELGKAAGAFRKEVQERVAKHHAEVKKHIEAARIHAGKGKHPDKHAEKGKQPDKHAEKGKHPDKHADKGKTPDKKPIDKQVEEKKQ